MPYGGVRQPDKCPSNARADGRSWNSIIKYNNVTTDICKSTITISFVKGTNEILDNDFVAGKSRQK